MEPPYTNRKVGARHRFRSKRVSNWWITRSQSVQTALAAARHSVAVNQRALRVCPVGDQCADLGALH
jgi:hypothetical protein